MTIVNNMVCAVIVTYYPELDTLDNISLVCPLVGSLIVVDNGSPLEQLKLLRAASKKLSFELIENGENLGLAAALNLGVRWAESVECRYVVLFDQDSTVTARFIIAMVQAYESHPQRERLALLGAAYQHKITGEYPLPGLLAKDGGPIEVMTSGSFFPISTFHKCGYFREDFFIDRVDYEYCFRVRDLGYQILYCPDALLLHAAGAPACFRIFGRTLLSFSNHSAIRWYYISRNSTVLLRKYAVKYPEWALHTVVLLLVKGPIKILIAREAWRDKLLHIPIGIWHGVVGKMGQLAKG